MKRVPSLLVAALLPLLLSACFGGGSDDAPAPVDPLAAVPDSAVQSVVGTVDYLTVLNKNPSDTREPLDISAVVLPTSDTTEPQVLVE
jgi:hypothetical protein